MNDFYDTIVKNLSSLTTEEFNKIIEIAQNKKEEIEVEKKRTAATDLVKAFIAYKEATGRNTIKFYDCSDWRDSSGPANKINIDHLFVDDNGDICHNILF